MNKVVDYNARLAEKHEALRGKVESGMLPMVARLPLIEEAVSEYVIARDEHLSRLHNPPIAFRDDFALHKMADLVLHEELTWSHPDKMSIVEYPIMSDRQRMLRNRDTMSIGDIEYGDRQHNGRKKSFYTDSTGSMRVINPLMANEDMEVFDEAVTKVDLHEAIEKANLTERQKEALFFVYIEDMTQEEAGEVMGLSHRRIVGKYIDVALDKIRLNLIN